VLSAYLMLLVVVERHYSLECGAERSIVEIVGVCLEDYELVRIVVIIILIVSLIRIQLI
jgi:hypothetical protein